ncbi:xanthine dehydrogenase small subunit [Aliamphritea hakodatensis]|uniref:xanthine dehydrogenase small subunit n=1 Tax=Aliamphritea hakodatensis TaxID=2895352 RepID=UPI0022FD4F36|nr:xanthine dehydrogenase small subunit [Aliamphritea hakodatensis]
MIQFLLNDELRSEDNLDPNTTVLKYLREQLGKTGTKEGCASGDCGACTVVLGELHNGSMRYKSINSCLTFVSGLNGKQLITVEDLKHAGELHPAQQAMVDCHGSQCGFCTPGFVMSMFALGKNIAAKNAPEPDKHDIHEALAGNLCRCTGYRPIEDAAASMAQQPDQFDKHQARTITRLQSIASQQAEQSTELQGAGRKAFNPRTLSELATLLKANPTAKLLAGGTDLALEVTQFHRDIDTLIYVGEVTELQQITTTDDFLELGAGASLTDCYASLTAEYPDFGALLQRFASLQIRNQGTLGGNIGNASPIGDSPPALIALNAQIVLRKGDQTRTLPLEEYFLSYKVTVQQPGEFIEKVLVPRAGSNQTFRSYKISKRLDDDISAVLGCFNLTVENGVIRQARVAFGGMAAIPMRARQCEQVLEGADWNKHTISLAKAALAEDFQPISDFRASKEYRLLTAANMLTRLFVELESPAVETRVTAYV